MKNKKIGAIMIIAMSLMLTACSNNSNETTDSTTTEETTEVATTETEDATEALTEETVAEELAGDETSYPITIQHAFGETVINEKPERIVTISWANQDVPLALGVIPVGISEANYGVQDGSGLLPWTAAKFKELGEENPVLFSDTDGLDFEAISDAEPDVILAAYSGITQEEYNLLSEIAPVVAYPTLAWQTYWRDQIILDATGMGMATEGQQLVTDLELLIQEKIAEYPQLEGKSAAFFYFNPADLGKFYIYLPTDPRAAYLNDLGMVVPESVATLAETTTSFALEISAENVDILQDIDIIVAYGDGTLLELLQADPLLGTVPAIQRGSVALIEDGTPLAASGTPSPLSIPATIDEYLTIMGEAADKAE
jgi:iron complex transport system substrate-binding protein